MIGGKRLGQWWDAQPDGQTCSTCGLKGSKAYVQPVHPDYGGGPGSARCTECRNAEIYAARDKRKAELAALPRCEADGCKARGAWRIGVDQTLVCGKHKRRAVAGLSKRVAENGMAWLAMFAGGGAIATREAVLRAVEEEKSNDPT